jgi:hypothetical protein
LSPSFFLIRKLQGCQRAPHFWKVVNVPQSLSKIVTSLANEKLLGSALLEGHDYAS